MRTRRFFIPAILLVALAFPARAQWRGQQRMTMHRGLVGHTIWNPGMTGRRDNHAKQGPSSFSYPMGRHLKVYSGGNIRDGWNARSNSGGEGIWILSKTGGTPHVSAAGSETVTPDVGGLPHDPSRWTEAYLGVVHHENYALAIRQKNGNRARWTDGAPLISVRTNWWPESGGISSARKPIGRQWPVVIWNFRYGRYNSGRSFAERIADGEFKETGSRAEALSEDDFPELVGMTRAESRETGLRWTRKWFQWGHTAFDDFLINETVVENTSGQTAEGVYIVFQNRFWQQQAGTWREFLGMWMKPLDWARDNHARSTAAANYLEGVSQEAFLMGAGKPAGLPVGKGLAEQGHAMLYAHDGESAHFSNLVPDVGDPYRYNLALQRFTVQQPWIREGYVQHSQYFGIGVIDAFSPFNTYGGADPDVYVDSHDNPDTELDEGRKQPASVTVWRYLNFEEFTHPSPLRHSPGFVYDALTAAGYPDEPEEAFSYSHFMTFGPYDLGPGEKCKVVVAYVGGQGANAPRFEDYRRYPKPFSYAWMNLSEGAGEEAVSFAERQREIPMGEEAMFRHFQQAIDVYTQGYDLPNQPPNIKLAFRSRPDGKTEIRWSAFGEDSPDPDYGGTEAQDLRGYRIYRSEGEYQGPWEFVTEFSFEDARAGILPFGVSFDPGGVFRTVVESRYPQGIPLRQNPYMSGTDLDAGAEIRGVYTFRYGQSKLGFPGWYAVRYYDSGHNDWKGTGQAVPVLESAPGPAGGAILGGRRGVVPVVPGTGRFDRLEGAIRVVPNPFKVDSDLHSYGRREIIRFINLPGRCQIDIYDVAGQHAWMQFHDAIDRAETVWGQETKGDRALMPGIYFWEVTSLMPGSEGKVQKGTFLIIK